MSRALKPGATITELVELEGLDKLGFKSSENLRHHLTSFCVDREGKIRSSRGIVSMSEATDEDVRYVPSFRYKVKMAPWNSHSDYLEIELPNPALDFKLYQRIRTAWFEELTSRLKTDLRKLMT